MVVELMETIIHGSTALRVCLVSGVRLAGIRHVDFAGAIDILLGIIYTGTQADL